MRESPGRREMREEHGKERDEGEPGYWPCSTSTSYRALDV